MSETQIIQMIRGNEKTLFVETRPLDERECPEIVSEIVLEWFRSTNSNALSGEPALKVGDLFFNDKYDFIYDRDERRVYNFTRGSLEDTNAEIVLRWLESNERLVIHPLVIECALRGSGEGRACKGIVLPLGSLNARYFGVKIF